MLQLCKTCLLLAEIQSKKDRATCLDIDRAPCLLTLSKILVKRKFLHKPV